MNTPTQNPSVRPAVLRFEGAELRVIDRDGQLWFTGTEISRALGYTQDQQVSRIYRRNEHEFKPSMTQVISLQASEYAQSANLALSGKGHSNLARQARIFSLRGAHLIAMFAKTSKAAAFRSWVLDVLEGLAPVPVQQQAQAQAPAPEPDPWARLVPTRVLMTLDSDGQSTAKVLPADAYIVRAAELAGWMREPGAFTDEQLLAIGVAALQRAKWRGGHGAVQKALSAVDEDYLLVNESKLTSCLYRATGLARGRYV